MKISIVGSGVVGQATGMGLARWHKVLFYDLNQQKLEKLKTLGYEVIKDIILASDSDVLMMCVQTPTVNGKIDLEFVLSASQSMGNVLASSEDYKLIIVRSTVHPYVTRKKIIPELEKHSGKKVGTDFGICTNPEFLRAKYSLRDFINSPVIVIGEFDERSGNLAEQLYSVFNVPIVRTTLENAEMSKYVANLYNSTKISFFNEVYMICEALGLDSDLISEAACKTALGLRFPEYGIKGGRPFGGACLPKDLDAMISFVKEDVGLNPELLEAVRTINKQIERFEKNRKGVDIPY